MKACARCHLQDGQRATGPPLAELRRAQGAFELAGRLWNHAPAMLEARRQQGVERVEVSPAEMADLMAYLGADPARDAVPVAWRGQAALVAKGCLKCHSLQGEGGTVGPDLGRRHAAYESPMAWASRMWTHAPRMAVAAAKLELAYPRFSGDELTNVVAFLRSAAR